MTTIKLTVESVSINNTLYLYIKGVTLTIEQNSEEVSLNTGLQALSDIIGELSKNEDPEKPIKEDVHS